MTISRLTVRDPYGEVAESSGRSTEGTAEILARKLQSRILDLGEFTDRDFYDLSVAQKRDLAALRRVLASVTEGESLAIASELCTLPPSWSGGEPVREPAYPDLLRNLAWRTRRLISSDPEAIG